MDCDDLDNLDVGVSFNGETYKLNPTDLDLGELSSGSCVIGVIASDQQDIQGNDLGILGAAFLKNVSGSCGKQRFMNLTLTMHVLSGLLRV